MMVVVSESLSFSDPSIPHVSFGRLLARREVFLF